MVRASADPELARVTARYQADLVLMHARGSMAEMKGFSVYADDAYGDVVADVLREWRAARDRALEAGLTRENVWLDPGIGFAKNAERSWELLRRLPELAGEGVPVVVGPSRKSFIGALDGSPPEGRLGGTIAACLLSVQRGAHVLRVHDVAAVKQALRVARELEGGNDDSGSSERSGRRVPESLKLYLASRTLLQLLRDGLDIFLVYYIVYRALLVLRGTRAMQVGMGLGMVFVLYVVARVLELVTVLTIMGALISSMILIIVVVFQNDIRRGLQRVGSRAWFSSFARAQESKVIDEVVEAATELARHRIGALITFEQDANLDEFVGQHKGHDLDAQVSRELLVSLFIPEGVNKLHDGSVIIRNLRIAKAGCVLPHARGARRGSELRLAPPRGARHHGGDGRGGRDRERGARHHQLLLQRQHRHQPRRAEAPQHAGSHLQPQGQKERAQGAQAPRRVTDARGRR